MQAQNSKIQNLLLGELGSWAISVAATAYAPEPKDEGQRSMMIGQRIVVFGAASGARGSRIGVNGLFVCAARSLMNSQSIAAIGSGSASFVDLIFCFSG
jgi:hypothetical protein